MFRVTTQPSDGFTIMVLAGRMTAEEVAELTHARDAVKGRVVLSLSGLESCAPEGIRVLREWLKAGAQLKDASPYLSMVLKPAAGENPPAKKQ